MPTANRTQTDVPLAITINKNGGVTGLTVEARVFEAVSGDQLDFNDNTFKTPGTLTTETVAVAELNSTEAPGLYRNASGLDLNATDFASGETHLLISYTWSGTEQGTFTVQWTISENAYNPASALDSHEGAIWIDTTNGSAGTTVGVNGTSRNPVNTLADAVTLAASSGLRTYNIIDGNLTLTSAHTNWRFKGLSADVSIAANGQNIEGSMFEDCLVSGSMVCGTVGISCVRGGISAANGIEGYLYSCPLYGTTTPQFNGPGLQAFNCEGGGAAGGIEVDMTNAGAGDHVFLHDFHGILTVLNLTNATARVAITGNFSVVVGATNTAGQLFVSGVGEVSDTGASLTILDDAFLNPNQQVIDTWRGITLS